MLALLLAAFKTAPAKLQITSEPVSLPDDIDAHISRTERAVEDSHGIVEGTAKRLRWLDPDGKQKTRYAIVYVHGFSATRQELAPICELLADSIGANLFETRLSAHGLKQKALHDVSAEDWVADISEALSIGAAIGEEVIVIGVSTGASLALAMSGRPEMQAVSTLVLVSPNFRLQDRSSDALMWPLGLQLAHLFVGDERSWEPKNELQAKYWTTVYPMQAVVEMLRLVRFVNSNLPLTLQQNILVIMSPEDTVVDAGRSMQALARIEAPRKHIHEVTETADVGRHVLAGDVISPQNNQEFVDVVSRFIAAQ